MMMSFVYLEGAVQHDSSAGVSYDLNVIPQRTADLHA